METNVETLNWLVARSVTEKLEIKKWKPVLTKIQAELDSDPVKYNTIESKLECAFRLALPHSRYADSAADSEGDRQSLIESVTESIAYC